MRILGFLSHYPVLYGTNDVPTPNAAARRDATLECIKTRNATNFLTTQIVIPTGDSIGDAYYISK